MYINDLDSNKVCQVLKFAADTKLYSKVNRSNNDSDLQKHSEKLEKMVPEMPDVIQL